MDNNINAKGHLLLGKETRYDLSYGANILTAIPRALNREEQGIRDHQFVGYDAWHAYEASCLLDNGLPFVGIMKIVVPSNSEFLVESKSLKLYFNGFNNEKLGATIQEVQQRFQEIVARDLSELLETDVHVVLHRRSSSQLQDFDFSDHRSIDEVSDHTLDYDAKVEKVELLVAADHSSETLKICSYLLRSNCRVTGQPDWGNIYISMRGALLPNTDKFVHYLTSLRNENHFHEEICEQIYTDLTNAFSPNELMVTCLYTRRGGIDICPVRASHKDLLPKFIVDSNVLTSPSFRQ